MFIKFAENISNETLQVCGIPFAVRRKDKVVQAISERKVIVNNCCDTLFFLGMSTSDWQCSEWWGQREAFYDHSKRLFLGDRIGRINVHFDDYTEELISVIFGVNCFNYNLFFGGKEHEGDLKSFDAPYNEPFRSFPQARELFNNAIAMNENTEDHAEKMTKWVFCYRPRSDKRIIDIEWSREDCKEADFDISAVTAAMERTDCPDNLKYICQDFFLGKKYYSSIDALSRRLYQYADELPKSDDFLSIDGFDAPDIRFYNEDGLDIFTNVYRANIMDMAYKKITDDGMSHTSSAGTLNFGCYIGFGTYTLSSTYGEQIWTRDTGRMLIEVINAGYLARAKMAIEKLHEMLYYPSMRFRIPHWKRIANMTGNEFNEGLENDGHASIMMAVYALYDRGGADESWLRENEGHLRAAAECYVWQYENPKESNFRDVFYSASETSTQKYGGYDLYSNVISITALKLYARLFCVIGDEGYAEKLMTIADHVREGILRCFSMDHPRFGKVLTDTTDDCWTYEYKRFAPILLLSDYHTLDGEQWVPELMDLMNRTFDAQKEVYYDPFSGRQMGYGQGYLTGAALALDRYEEYTDCINSAAAMCYHHTDGKYIVPEGVIVHGSRRFWYRNCDLGNGVQQAEIVKCVRLIVGADDLDMTRRLCLVPRLPATFLRIEARNLKVRLSDRTFAQISYTYGRGSGEYTVMNGKESYYLEYEGPVKPEMVRFGPFKNENITVSENLLLKEVRCINGLYYAYVWMK